MSEIVGFEHLHVHSHFSLLDGYGDIFTEYGPKLKKINQKHLSISDHGMMGGVPSQVRTCDEYNLSPIFACELYCNPEQLELKEGELTGDYIKQMGDEGAQKRLRKSYHLLAIAKNEVGYSNLVKLSSWAWLKGFYYKPRVNYKILQQYKEGIIFSTACYNSEIGNALKVSEDAAMDVVQRYKDMFPELYLEMMMLDFRPQKGYDAFLIKAHQKFGLPLLLTNDVHYCEAADSEMQRLMLMIQTNKTLAESQAAIIKAEAAGESIDLFELQDRNLWMKSEEELNSKWEKDYSDVIDADLFRQAKMNTVKICEAAKGVKLDRSVKLPRLPDDNAKFKQAIFDGFVRRGLPKTQEYIDRIKEEYNLICEKEFSSYFLIQKMMVDEARRYWREKTGDKFGSAAVGPGRGSAVGSLCCYCLGITDVDPIKHGLLFSRFLSPARGGKSIKLRFKSAPVAA